MRQDVVLYIGPTNSAKTYDALEFLISRAEQILQEFKDSPNIEEHPKLIYAGPLRLLAREMFHKLRRRLPEGQVGMVTSEEQIHPNALVMTCTTECAPISGDTLVLDEAHWVTDSERGSAWTRLLAERAYRYLRICAASEFEVLFHKIYPSGKTDAKVEVIRTKRLSTLTWHPTLSRSVAFSRLREMIVAEAQARDSYLKTKGGNNNNQATPSKPAAAAAAVTKSPAPFVFSPPSASAASGGGGISFNFVKEGDADPFGINKICASPFSPSTASGGDTAMSSASTPAPSTEAAALAAAVAAEVKPFEAPTSTPADVSFSEADPTSPAPPPPAANPAPPPADATSSTQVTKAIPDLPGLLPEDFGPAILPCVLVAFSRDAVLSLAAYVESAPGMKGRVGVLYGAMPPQSREEQITKLERGELLVVVSTDVLGHGISLGIRTVVFAETTKFDGTERRSLKVWEAAQIAGRAGRGTAKGYCTTLASFKGMECRQSIIENAITVANGLNPAECAAISELKVTKAYLRPSLRQLTDMGASNMHLLPLALRRWAKLHERAADENKWIIPFPIRTVLDHLNSFLSDCRGANSSLTDEEEQILLNPDRTPDAELAYSVACSPISNDNFSKFSTQIALARPVALPTIDSLRTQSLESLEKNISEINDCRIVAHILHSHDAKNKHSNWSRHSAMQFPTAEDIDRLYEEACAIHVQRLQNSIPGRDKCACGREKTMIFHKSCSYCFSGGGGFGGGGRRYGRRSYFDNDFDDSDDYEDSDEYRDSDDEDEDYY